MVKQFLSKTGKFIQTNEKAVFISAFAFMFMMIVSVPIYLFPVLIAGLLFLLYKVKSLKFYILYSVLFSAFCAVSGLLTSALWQNLPREATPRN